ncbi:MAG: DUF3662 and FHA domain-containing protein [Anaerolineae bacterium]
MDFAFIFLSLRLPHVIPILWQFGLFTFSASAIIHCMKDQHITRLEAQLERLVENSFAQLFGRKLRSHEIAMQLARAMEDNSEAIGLDDNSLVAPDYYAVHVNPDVQKQLTERYPTLSVSLSDYMIEMASSAGFRLNSRPIIEFVPNKDIAVGNVIVRTRHSRKKTSTTAVMQRVELAANNAVPLNPQLLLHGRQPLLLLAEVINIGRSHDNQIVIDDKTVSRHHIQLRLRFGRYVLFDAQSQSGTYVNDVLIREHSLQSGDVIRIGNTQLVYMEDNKPNDTFTQTVEPVSPSSQN